MFGKNKLKGDAVMERRTATLMGPPVQVAPEGVDTGQVWLAAFEIVKPEAAITYVSHPDGTTHAYFSNGRGFEHLEKGPSVADASRAFVALAAQYMGDMGRVGGTPHPDARHVTFWCREGEATYGLTIMEDVVAVGGHPLTKLYRAGLAVTKHAAAAM